MKNEKILNLTKKVRSVCERFACSDDASAFDFWRDPDLGCMCAIASMTLAKVLRKFGYRVNVVNGKFRDNYAFNNNVGYDHCWVEYGTNIIDITATQFQIKDEIFICKAGNNCHYIKGIVKNSVENFSNWDISQRPDKRIVSLLVNNSLNEIQGV